MRFFINLFQNNFIDLSEASIISNYAVEFQKLLTNKLHEW